MSRFWGCAVRALVLVLAPTPLVAEERWEPGEPTTARMRGEVAESRRGSSEDGVYGRFDGDFDFGAALGADLMKDTTLGAARLTLHYFSTVGVHVEYADALGRSSELGRLTAFGVDLRPLFIPRWSEDREQGPAALDLAIDSLSIGMGAFFAQPRGGDFGSTRGFELSAGLGVPLLGSASGPWLEARYLLRWPNPGRGTGERAESAVLALLSWHTLWLSGLSD